MEKQKSNQRMEMIVISAYLGPRDGEGKQRLEKLKTYAKEMGYATRRNRSGISALIVDIVDNLTVNQPPADKEGTI